MLWCPVKSHPTVNTDGPGGASATRRSPGRTEKPELCYFSSLQAFLLLRPLLFFHVLHAFPGCKYITWCIFTISGWTETDILEIQAVTLSCSSRFCECKPELYRNDIFNQVRLYIQIHLMYNVLSLKNGSVRSQLA